MAKKNMIIALVLSLIWSGLGLIYAGDVQKGIILAVIAIIAEVLYLFVNQIFGIVVFIIWIYSLYATYNEVKVSNGPIKTLNITIFLFLIGFNIISLCT